MKIELYPKNMLERLWKKDKKWFSDGIGQKPVCLRCGNPLDEQLMVNSLSRHAKIYVCQQCGADEAMRDYAKIVMPFENWYGVTSKRVEELPSSKSLSLTTMCSFLDIFPSTDAPGRSKIGRPGCEIAYSRSDYDGYRWWTTWFHCQQEPTPENLSKEIDQFQNALFCMPEFKTLGTMQKLCIFAEPVGNYEFNLFSETTHLYIWLRMLTQPKNYNLYVHYYQKELS